MQPRISLHQKKNSSIANLINQTVSKKLQAGRMKPSVNQPRGCQEVEHFKTIF